MTFLHNFYWSYKPDPLENVMVTTGIHFWKHLTTYTNTHFFLLATSFQ